ncbi:glycosyltransferase [Azospirillum sp. TSO22-1]|uniref:glycosyltransferase n=1 Tax=Azospirillum sp. TSO22-1 TaxID=716789 RepID=UPI000D603DCF|nr:glycosyltransferase [Azospirillum sp. TSO22-1]PWC55331.1 hypothetical protein TSO221_05220 [Azospirillum sp. TSO22-1]
MASALIAPFDPARPLRVLIGTMENGENLSNFAEGLKQLGHTVTKVFQFAESQHGRRIVPDHLLRDVLAGTTYGIPAEDPDTIFWNPGPRIQEMIDGHDLFIFQSGKTLLPGNDDLPVIRNAGKRIVSVFTGTDVRHWSAAEPQYSSWGRRYWPAHTEKWDQPHPTKSQMVLDQYFYNNWSVANKIYTLRMAELYSDVILSVPEQAGLAIRPYFHFHVPIDANRFTAAVPDREVPIVVHAPSHRIRKGSDFIQYAVNLLNFQGVKAEYRQFEGLDNAVVAQELSNADIAVDQIFAMMHGGFALEAMAAGCAVLASNVPEFMPGPEERPILDVHPGNLHTQLRRLIEDRALRRRLGEEARRHVERHHTPVAAARHLLNALARAEADDFDYWPSFFLQHYRLPRSEVLPPHVLGLNLEVIRSGRVPRGTHPTLLRERGLIPDAPLDPFERSRFLQRTDPAIGPYGLRFDPIDFP